MMFITARTVTTDGLPERLYMRNHGQRLLLIAIVLLGAIVGVAEQALAQFSQ